MFMMLNTLYLEWRFNNDHLHSEEEFNITLESLIRPLAKNIKDTCPQNRFLIDDFEKIFVDFPDKFKKTVLECITSAYNKLP